MKILHVLDHSIPLHSGYAFRTLAILRHQHALGWTTEQITSSKHPSGASFEEMVEGLRFFRTPARGGRLSRLPVADQWAVVRDLEARLEQVVPVVRPDIIHAHSPALNGLAALAVARRHALPMVYEVRAFWEDAAVDHGTTSEGSLRYRLGRALETRVLKRADAVTTISLGLRDDILARGIPASRMTLVPNAVDLARFDPHRPVDPALRRQLGLAGKTVVGFIGSFYGYEGLGLIIEALAQILPAEPQVRVLLVGGGAQEAALKQAVAARSLSDFVVFTGRVPHDRVPDYYQLIDVLAYPRLPMRLTQIVTPLKPLEAMAAGRLVVASDVGGHRELIRDGANGVLFRANDATSLAAAVREVLRSPERAAAMRTAGRRFVEAERSWPAVVARYRPVYGGLLGR